MHKLNAARVKYHVPNDRLYRRTKGVPPSLGHGNKQAALINYIKCCDDIGFSAMPQMILGAAVVILKAEITTSHASLSWPRLGFPISQSSFGA